MKKKAPMDHEIRVWLTASTFLAAESAAEEDDRSMSGYVRRLIERDLEDRLRHRLKQTRDEDAPLRAVAGR